LGCSEAGKTTFIRQFRRILGQGFSPKERRDFASFIREDAIQVPFLFDLELLRAVDDDRSSNG